jgi:rSAM/selenodomain-associated transferase 2
LSRPSVSIVIPTYQEAAIIEGLLSHLEELGAEETIVADGGSTDGTAALANARAKVVTGPACRAIQMNLGAQAARGDILLFLHADVRLGTGALEAMRSAMRDVATLGGNFDVRYDGGGMAARVFSVINRQRRRFGVFYGDSGIFCRRTVFQALGGFQAWPVLEDYDLARRLCRAGKLALLREPIYVSDRRWRTAGLLPTLWAWFWIQGLYLAGVSPHRLARMYRPVR